MNLYYLFINYYKTIWHLLKIIAKPSLNLNFWFCNVRVNPWSKNKWHTSSMEKHCKTRFKSICPHLLKLIKLNLTWQLIVTLNYQMVRSKVTSLVLKCNFFILRLRGIENLWKEIRLRFILWEPNFTQKGNQVNGLSLINC